MRALLGLADRGRIFDLFDLVMAGSVSAALAEFEAQYVMGADPTVILADMAELTHWLTRLKFVPAAQEDIAFSAQLRSRGVEAAEKLSTRILSRVWQVLAGMARMKRRDAANARAAEMVLIRLAHLADMPTPEELIKQYDSAPNLLQPHLHRQASAPSGGAPAGPLARIAMMAAPVNRASGRNWREGTSGTGKRPVVQRAGVAKFSGRCRFGGRQARYRLKACAGKRCAFGGV